MGHQQVFAINMQRNIERTRRHISEIVGLYMGCLASSHASMIEYHMLMVAKHIVGIALPQHLDYLVAEAVLEHGVAGTEQLVDVAHPFEREGERVRVAVDIGNDAEAHDRSNDTQGRAAAIDSPATQRSRCNLDASLDARKGSDGRLS